jgi:tyrosyl-tRNA synthetase
MKQSDTINVGSTGEGIRLIIQGGVSIDGKKWTDPKRKVSTDREKILKVGKRSFLRIVPYNKQ